MKKFLSLLICLTLIFGITACEGNNQEQQAENQESSSSENVNDDGTDDSEQTEQNGALEIGDEMVSGNYSIIIDSVRRETDYEGNDAIVVNYTFFNNGEETESAASSVMVSAFQDGVELSTTSAGDFTNNNAYKDLRPGNSIDNCENSFVFTSETSPIEIEMIAAEEYVFGEPVLAIVDMPQ